MENNTDAGNGNGRGFNSVNLTNCRVAGNPTYIPAHTKAGAAKVTQAQTNFTVFQNIWNKKHEFKITAWGKMADAIAKGAPTGKQLFLECSLHTYRGRVWLPTPPGAERQFVLRGDGQPLTETKVGLTLERMIFGVDSAKTIQEEIQTGFRPVGWNDPSQPGYQTWRNICVQNNALTFQQGMTRFGYATVQLPNGQITYSNTNQNQNQGQATTGFQGAQPNTGFQGAQPNTQTYGAQPQTPQHNQGNAQYVNGEYVGQATTQHPQTGGFGGAQTQPNPQHGGFTGTNTGGANPIM